LYSAPEYLRIPGVVRRSHFRILWGPQRCDCEY